MLFKTKIIKIKFIFLLLFLNYAYAQNTQISYMYSISNDINYLYMSDKNKQNNFNYGYKANFNLLLDKTLISMGIYHFSNHQRMIKIYENVQQHAFHNPTTYTYKGKEKEKVSGISMGLAWNILKFKNDAILIHPQIYFGTSTNNTEYNKIFVVSPILDIEYYFVKNNHWGLNLYLSTRYFTKDYWSQENYRIPFVANTSYSKFGVSLGIGIFIISNSNNNTIFFKN